MGGEWEKMGDYTCYGGRDDRDWGETLNKDDPNESLRHRIPNSVRRPGTCRDEMRAKDRQDKQIVKIDDGAMRVVFSFMGGNPARIWSASKGQKE